MSSRMRLVLWAGALIVLTGACLIGVRWALLPTCGITTENGASVKEGMSREEVHSLLAIPPGDYSDGKNAAWHDRTRQRHMLPYAPSGPREEWRTRNVLVLVCYDDNGRVTKRFVNTIVNETPFDYLRRWLFSKLPF